ncbi:MAG: ABC transporter permease [Pelovirga sp.]
MNYLLASFGQALELILSFERELLQIVWSSVHVSVWGILLASLVGIPLGMVVGLGRFAGRRLVITLLNTMMALPTVVVGLFLFGLFSRQGPLGFFGILFTPTAIIAGLAVLATPIVTNYVVATVSAADPRIIPTAMTLGATPLQARIALFREVRFGLVAAIVAGFGRVISEVGVAMMLGGNIRGSTRTMTTAIALETSKGEFVLGLALGLVLLSVALAVNLVLNYFQHRD